MPPDIRLRDRAIARTLPLMPRRLVRRLSSPYIAGESLDQAVAVIERLHARGMSSTLDVLGEAISHRHEAEATRDHYLGSLERLAQLGDPQLLNVSVKLTALGLAIDERLCFDNTRAIVARAHELGGFVRIDMEDSPYTDATLDLARQLRREGFVNTGVVIQAYLKRSVADVEALVAEGVRTRIVKGIYIEPATIAYKDMPSINRNFVALSRMLCEGGVHVAFATHDDELVRATQGLVRDLQVPVERYEYQMLLGVREPLRDELVGEGHPMRVYVPFGAKWYEYSIRRLRENPRVAGHVAADILNNFGGRLRRGGRRRQQQPHGVL